MSYRAGLLALFATLAPLVALADGTYDAQGVYVLPYGTASPPTLTCAPGHVCSLILQPGETIYDLVAGDLTHWAIDKGTLGVPAGHSNAQSVVIFIEPLDLCVRDATGMCTQRLTTNLIIDTDRRQYELRLVADASIQRTRYGFFYPHDDDIHVVPATAPTPAENTSAEGSSSTSCIDTARNYRIDATGNPAYTPLLVCNDGISTWIVLRDRTPIPSVYLVLDNGQQTMTNVHPADNVLKLDGLPNHILLVGDVGKHAPHIDIYRLR